MKTLLRNNLWLSILAWSLFLYGYEILGIVTIVIDIIYLVIFNTNVNFWRVVSISMIFGSLSSLLVSTCNIGEIYSLIIPFLILVNINTALLHEVLAYIPKNILNMVNAILIGTIIIATTMIYLMPDSPFIPYIKMDMFIYVIVMFIPTFLDINVSLIQKAHYKKALKA